MKTFYFEPLCGDTIHHACEVMVKRSQVEQARGVMDFNDVELMSYPDTTAEDLVQQYQTAVEKRRQAYEQTPAYREQQTRYALQQARAAAAKAEGFLPFTLSNPEGWQASLNNNQDPYGACALRYAARWAAMMEEQIAQGKAVAEIASQCSFDADLEGITGFMQGAARSILCQVWQYGPELRNWYEAGEP